MIDINSAIKSLTNRRRDLEINTNRIKDNSEYYRSFINTHSVLNNSNEMSPKQIMDPSTATLKAENPKIQKRLVLVTKNEQF